MLVTNYTNNDYGANPQNWGITQDPRGVIYVANTDGVLEYDGYAWKLISLNDEQTARSVASDFSDGTIYVGSMAEIGYLAADSIGSLCYVSLMDKVPHGIEFSNVDKIFFDTLNVYFCAPEYILVLSKSTHTIESWPMPVSTFLSFMVNGNLLTSTRYEGLKQTSSTGIVTMKNAQTMEPLIDVEAIDNENIIVESRTQFYQYNINTGEKTPFPKAKEVFDYMNKNMALVYGLEKTTDGRFVMGAALSKDYVLTFFDKNFEVSNVVNRYNGIQDNTTFDMKATNDGNVWAAMNVGVSRVESHLPLAKFGTESGLEGVMLEGVNVNGELYFSTSEGLFYRSQNKLGFAELKKVEGLDIPVITVIEYTEPYSKKKMLMAGTQNGLFKIIDHKARLIDTYPANKIYQSKIDPRILYVNCYELVHFEFITDDKFVIKENIPGYEKVRNYAMGVCEDANGDFWISPEMQGVMRKPAGQDTLIPYGLQNGLPIMQHITIFTSHKGEPLFCTPKGVYTFNRQTDQFEPYAPFIGLSSNETDQIVSLCHYGKGYAVLRKNGIKNWFEILLPDSTGQLKIFDTPLKRMPGTMSEMLYVDDEGVLWMGQNTDVYSFKGDTSLSFESMVNHYSCAKPFNTLIRKVSSRNVELYNGAPIKTSNYDKIATLPYSDNNVDFRFSATFFEQEQKTEFSWMLVGQDKEWSSWALHHHVNYNNLKEGLYKFKVKSRNIYGQEGSIETFAFRVKPPFYRTLLAYVLYTLIGTFIMFCIVKLNNQRLFYEKEQLANEVHKHTIEIEYQKEAIETQKEEIEQSIRYASRIQRALFPPQDVIDAVFPKNFLIYQPRNVVSGDFYWISQTANRKICVVADCTGHGVPGGFMSMLGFAFLNQIVDDTISCENILYELRTLIISNLRQEVTNENSNRDGMDVGVFTLDTKTNHFEFAGANRPAIIIRGEELIYIKGDRMAISIDDHFNDRFTKRTFDLESGDKIYMFSDGYVDQFGGEHGNKLLIKNFKDVLMRVSKMPMKDQKRELESYLVKWQGKNMRTDDVIVLGIEI